MRVATVGPMALTSRDLELLTRCVDLAEQAVEAGDEPFGSLLLSADGEVLFEDHNHVSGGDGTRHPELAIAHWAVEHLTPQERADMVADDGRIAITCEFCSRRYDLDPAEVEAEIAGQPTQ